jgi:hypothetical protein
LALLALDAWKNVNVKAAIKHAIRRMENVFANPDILGRIAVKVG